MSTSMRRLIGRLALVWFALALGVAVASPLVHPQSVQWICSGASVKTVVLGDDGAVEAGAGQMHCPLCLPLSGAPPVARIDAPQASWAPALACAHRPVLAVPSATGQPWYARGPPLA